MSAIVSLLRVMTLRDAEAITIEPGRVPTLRRRGQVETLAMPAIDRELVEAFVAPLLVGKCLTDGAISVSYVDADGTSFPVTLDAVAGGTRIVARRPHRPAPTSQAPPLRPAARTPQAAPAPRPARTSESADSERPEHLIVHHASEAHHEDAIDQLAALLATPLATARSRGASDVLLSTGREPRMRIDGRLESLGELVDDHELAAVVRAIGGSSAISLDRGLEVAGARARVHLFDHLAGYAIAVRLIRDTVPSLGELGLPPEIAAIADLRDGLVLVCGPTGSGKSTTLASLVDLIDQRRASHIVTLEDPIEVKFAARRCSIHQREIGRHITSFAEGLRAALREAPDVILLGELRDRETIAAALTAAETGHLVLATLHAPSAASAVDRVIDAFPEGQQRQIRQQLAACLRTVVTQYLVPRKDGGRAVAVEHVPVTQAVANIIRKGDLHTLATAIQSGRDAGMIPLERSLARLLDSGTVSSKAVHRIAADHDLLAALASKLR